MKKLPHEKLTDFLIDKIGRIKYEKLSIALENIVLYFNNLTDALLGRTQGFVTAMYSAVDGVSQQAFELMLEKERLEKELEEALNRLGKKPAKKTATTARKAPKKKTSGK